MSQVEERHFSVAMAFDTYDSRDPVFAATFPASARGQLKMSAELLATYSGLGTQDGDNYYPGEDCLG